MDAPFQYPEACVRHAPLWVSGRPLPLPLGVVMMQSEDGEGNTTSTVPGVGATIGRPPEIACNFRIFRRKIGSAGMMHLWGAGDHNGPQSTEDRLTAM